MAAIQAMEEPFAYLIPINDVAKRLFSHAIDYIQLEGDQHHTKFLEEKLHDLSLIMDTPNTDSDLTDESYDIIDNLVPGPELRKGGFVLSLHHEKVPAFPHIGWRAGRGTSKLPHYNIDFLLASPRHAGRSELPSLGIYFRFHPDSGMLMVSAGKKSISYKIDGEWIEIPASSQYVLLKVTNTFRLNRCEYQLVFCVTEGRQKDFFAHRNKWIDRFCRRSPPVAETWQLPSELPYRRIGDIMICKSLAYGGFGWVSKAVDCKTGNLIAVKEVSVRSDRDGYRVVQEANFGKEFEDVERLLYTIDLCCEHYRDAPCGQNPERIYLSFPLGQSDFLKPDWWQLDSTVFLTLFYKTLIGIYELHGRGIIHRDITVKNMLVLSLEPPNAVICDFGKALRMPNSVETSIGPIPSLAPEVYGDAPYTSKIDIWAWAYAVAQALCYSYSGNERITVKRHADICDRLLSFSCKFLRYKDFFDLLRTMLVWDPDKRVSSEAALQHTCWDAIKDSTQSGGGEESFNTTSTDPNLDKHTILEVNAPLRPVRTHKPLLSIPDITIKAPRNDNKRKSTNPTRIGPKIRASSPPPSPQPDLSTESGESSHNSEDPTQGTGSSRSLDSLQIEARKRRDTAAAGEKLKHFTKEPKRGDDDRRLRLN